MQTVKVSPKYQIVTPKEVREKLKLRPGQELFVYELDGSIRVEPHRSIKSLCGMAKESAGKKATVTIPSAFKLILVHSSGWLVTIPKQKIPSLHQGGKIWCLSPPSCCMTSVG